MPTAPFSQDFIDKLAEPTAWKFDSILGSVFTPRFMCCTDPNLMNVAGGKAPVALLTVSPNPVYVGETINYSGTLSYDPDGSITGYAWTFESHTPASGTAMAGTLNYGTAGLYTFELIVTDGTGLQSSPARKDVLVMPAIFAGYVGSTAGVFYSDGQSPITWTDKNAGLTAGLKPTYDVVIDPATQNLAENEKVVWRVTDGRILFSRDGGATWTVTVPASVSNVWGDSPAPGVLNLTYRQLLFVGDRLYVMATWQNASSAWRSFIFYTDNAADVRASASATVTWTEVVE